MQPLYYFTATKLDDVEQHPNSIFRFRSLMKNLQFVKVYSFFNDFPKSATMIHDVSDVHIRNGPDMNTVQHLIKQYHDGYKIIFSTNSLVEANVTKTEEQVAMLEYHQMLIDNGVDPSDIICWHNDAQSPEDFKVLSVPVNFFELDAYYRSLSCDTATHEQEKTHDMLALVGKINKPNRAPLLAKLKYLDQIKTIHSFYGSETEFRHAAWLLGKDMFDDNKIRAYRHLKTLEANPDNIDYNLSNHASHYCGYPFDVELYEKTKFSLIMETHYDKREEIFLTEKTFRTIINRHPFVMAATRGTCKYLQDLGYKTFGSEEYDFIADDTLRLYAIIKHCFTLTNTNKDLAKDCEDNYNTLERRAITTSLQVERTLSRKLSESTN